MADLPPPPPPSGLTAEDVVRARELWRKHAPPVWRTLLDAPRVEAEQPEPIVKGPSL